MAKKRIAIFCIIGACVLAAVSSFIIWKIKTTPNFEIDRVRVEIKPEYMYKFNEFTVEDFEWDNALSIGDRWSSNAGAGDLGHGGMVIHLRKHGKKEVLEAIDHLKTLDFVANAEVYIISYATIA